MPPKLEKEQYSKSEVEDMLRKQNEATDEKLEVANLVAEMTDAEKTHYKSLEGDAKNEFLFASSDERSATLAKAADADPVVYTATDGTEIRKSDGAKMLKMAQDNDANLKDIKDLQKQAEQNRLEKAAENEYKFLPGELSTRVALIKAAESIEDETERQAALDALKAQSAKLSEALKNRGSSTTNVGDLEKGDGETEMDNLTKAYMQDHPDVSFYDAYDKVAELNPEVYAKAVAGE